ncbi:MAG TPA: glycosyltransferase family 2 protein [Thermoanaerobaculia bacterium]|jgi:dolichol-phosphate mannosyltransferase
MIAEPRVSVAVPLYNEESVLGELLRRLGSVLDSLPGGPHEMVFVDDGSRDRTFEILEEAASRDPRLTVASLSRNWGHQAAISAALDLCRGDVVVIMDGDLQDRPEEIPRFLDEYRKGFDVVYARRSDRKESWPMRVSYHLFYRLIGVISQVPLPLDSGDFALLSGQVVDAIRQLPEHHRYLRGLRAWVGFRQIAITVERAARHSGTPKYTLRRLFRLAFDGIFSFTFLPLRIATALGSLTIFAALLYAAYAIFLRVVRGVVPEGFTGLLVVVTLLSGIQLLFLGVIGEYVGRVYEEARRRPNYIIRRVVGRSAAAPDSRNLPLG